MTRCVVIGGNGFLGSYMVDELAARGHEVSAFDRFSAGTPAYAASDVRAVVGDFLNVADLRDALSGQDYLFHFLSTTTPASAENNPSLDVRTNVSQSVQLLELAVEAGVSKVYFASTGGAIYGDQGAVLIDEGRLPAPVSPYAIGKQAIEGYLRYFHRKHGLESVSFRISNPYGPRQHVNKKQGVIPIFLHAVAGDRPVELLGDGTAVRDFIYAADAARMMVETVGRTTEHAVYNIGSGAGSSLNEVIGLVREVTGREIRLERKPQPATYVQRSVLDVSRYHAEFGGSELLTLRQGIERTWDASAGEIA